MTITGIMKQVKPELAGGLLPRIHGIDHFIGAMAVLILFHRVLRRMLDFLRRRRVAA
jgi:hypothetical protein